MVKQQKGDGKPPKKSGPLSLDDATKLINKISNGSYDLNLTEEVREELRTNSLYVGDLRYVFQHGEVVQVIGESTKEGLFKYQIVFRSPNSLGRLLMVEVIASSRDNLLKACKVQIGQKS